MSSNLINLVGRKVGRLTVLSFARTNKHGSSVWKCRCDCGTEKEIESQQLREEKTKSCGCLKRDTAGKASVTHGHTSGGRTPTYRSWRSMMIRCYRPQEDSYKYYGAKGITVCERWKSYENFLADLGERPDGMTLDRVDSLGMYEPGNCRWSDAKTQSRNRGLHINNTSGAKNVSWIKSYQRWRVAFCIEGKKTYFGHFQDFSEAMAEAERVRASLQ